MNSARGLLAIALALLAAAPAQAAASPAESLIAGRHALRGDLDARLRARGLSRGRPVFIRITKRERRLELFMQRPDRTWVRLEAYRICAWSGALGPKLREGDGQSPEGFYVVGAKQLKPDSSYHRAFNLGFPNAYDQAHGRTGSALMVHGDCVSIGCYAMTDVQIAEIYALVAAAIRGGQGAVPVHVFPFAMTDENLRREAANPWAPFWANLAEGWRAFERDGRPPSAYACGRRYGFSPAANCRRIAPWP